MQSLHLLRKILKKNLFCFCWKKDPYFLNEPGISLSLSQIYAIIICMFCEISTDTASDNRNDNKGTFKNTKSYSPS